MVRSPRFLVLTILFLGLGSTTAAAQPYERTVRDTLRHDITHLSVDSEEGSIALSTWDRDAVAYRARIVSGQARDIVDQTRITTDSAAGQLRISTDHSGIEMEWRFGPEFAGYGAIHPQVHYAIKVPSSMNAIIDGEASRIQVEDLTGKLQIDAEGEPGPQDLGEIVGDLLGSGAGPDAPTVTVEGQRGPARLEVEDGPVAVTGMRGNLATELDEGLLTIDEHRGALALDVDEGRAEVDVDSLRDTALATDEGRIELTMPRDAGFMLSTDLDKGAVLEAGVDLAPFRDGEGNYSGSVRGGGPLLRVESDEGTVVLHAR